MRIFLFDSMVADELQKQLSPEAASSGFYPMVMQAPLQNVESVTFRPACPLFPNGSVVVRFRVSKDTRIRYSKYTWKAACKGVDDYLLSRAATM